MTVEELPGYLREHWPDVKAQLLECQWMSLEMARHVFTFLQSEMYLASLHLAGGEATARFGLLLDVVRLAVQMGMPLAHLETNAAWCQDRCATRERMESLRAAGLPGLLVSASVFHNEHVPFSATRNAVEIGRDVFGEQSVTGGNQGKREP
jgi:hypothetical protein